MSAPAEIPVRNPAPILSILFCTAVLTWLVWSQDFDWTTQLFLYLVIVGCAVFIALPSLMSDFVAGGVEVLMRIAVPICVGFLLCLVYSHLHKTAAAPQNVFPPAMSAWGAAFAEVVHSFVSLARFDDTYKEPFYTAISTLFSIIVALALVRGMEDVQRHQQLVSEEAMELRSVIGYAKYLVQDNAPRVNKEAIRELFQNLKQYVDKVATDPKEANVPNFSGLLGAQRGALGRLTVARNGLDGKRSRDDNDVAVLPLLLESFEDFLMLRAKRLSTAKPQAPFIFTIILWLMAIAMLLPFLAEPLCLKGDALIKETPQFRGLSIDDIKKIMTLPECAKDVYFNPERLSQYFMIGVVAAFFSFALMFLQDLRDPYTGSWKIDMEDFAELVETLKVELAVLDRALSAAEEPTVPLPPADAASPDGRGTKPSAATAGETG